MQVKKKLFSSRNANKNSLSYVNFQAHLRNVLL